VWSFTLDELQRYYERVVARIGTEGMPVDSTHETDEPPPFFAALEGWYLTAAATLGRRTGELHLALARGTSPAFAPEPFDEESLRDFAALAVTHANDVLDRLAHLRHTLQDPGRGRAELVLDARADLIEQLKSAGSLSDGGLRTRVHGDYHLGQVLRTEEDFVVLDFEGEPGRTLAERRGKTSPLKDVAGMLRSFHYASQAALIAFSRSSPATADQLRPWAETWQYWAARSFLDSYRETMADSGILPAGAAFDRLLGAFVLDKALYELGYELNNRPDWARIPLHALSTLALPLQR
jgi:maltose alpha-D-glucosyltransferase/alpha-amylase